MIFAIGGAVIKTAREELIELISRGHVEMLIHNGGSIFHDFQLATEDLRGKHSYPLTQLLADYSCNAAASEEVWDWLTLGQSAPRRSITALCESLNIPVLMFTAPGADFWHLQRSDWTLLARAARDDFDKLAARFQHPFHYVCMGSAVIHPEIFIKALAVAKPTEFRADVVDFLDMYRPRTRVAVFGNYFQMNHKNYLQNLIKEGERNENSWSPR
jgi:hypothetical protein